MRTLGLLVLAGLTPPDWEITVIDECLSVPDYTNLPPYDLVGITAFTSQACRTYESATAADPLLLGAHLYLDRFFATAGARLDLLHRSAFSGAGPERSFSDTLGPLGFLGSEGSKGPAAVPYFAFKAY